MKDLSRNVGLVCPVCGCAQFARDESPEGSNRSGSFVCAHCGRGFTREELIDANRETIDATVEEMGDEVVDIVSHEFDKQLKKWGFKVRRR